VEENLVFCAHQLGEVNKLKGGNKKTKILFKDKAGNTIRATFIKSRNTIQLTARNKQGRIINPKGTRTLLRKAKISTAGLKFRK